MPAASDLFEAKNFALQNVWGKFEADASLRASMISWKNDGLGQLTAGKAEQDEARNWIIPTLFSIQTLPTDVNDQTELDVELIICLLSRAIERMEVINLSAQQITDIVDAYNAAWA